MTALLDSLQYEFAQNAILAGLIVTILGALIGFFIVIRRMAFVAVGISHAALGGVAIGVLLHQAPLVWAIVFSIVVAFAMAALGQRGMSEDTAMGIFFPAAMAFGVVVISYSDSWQRDLLSYLFGNILAISRTDLYILGGVSLVVGLLVAVFFKELLFISFDEESAHAAGVPVAQMRTLLLVLTSVTVVVALKVVGTVLVSAMLVIPTATASQWTSRWKLILAGAGLVGLLSLFVGLLISFQEQAGVGTGPAAVLAATAFFFLSALLSRLFLGRQQVAATALAASSDPVEVPPLSLE